MNRARAGAFTCAFFGLTIAWAAATSACGDGDSPESSSTQASSTGPTGATITLPDGAVVQADGAPLPAVDDAGDIAPPPPFIDGGKAFDFAQPYVAALGPSSRSDAGHNFPANVPPSNPKGTICITCHVATGTAATMPFLAGGTVKQQTDGGPAVMAEVRLKAYISSKAVSAYTDVDGNWFVTKAAADAAGIAFSVRPGIRNASIVRMMGSSPAVGTCNKCHIAYL